jgi:translation initiation factor 2B subunit (eIF-2B alpha/beta/delta family)
MEFASQKEELKHRLEARRQDLLAHIERIKADASEKARQTEASLEERLTRIQKIVRQGLDHMGEDAARRLNEMLKN